MLWLICFSGPQNDLESYCCGEVNCRGVNVGSLLSSISELQLRAWGIQLAVMLLSFEAPAQDIARSFGKPTLHVCVNLTLQSGKGLCVNISKLYPFSSSSRGWGVTAFSYKINVLFLTSENAISGIIYSLL